LQSEEQASRIKAHRNLLCSHGYEQCRSGFPELYFLEKENLKDQIDPYSVLMLFEYDVFALLSIILGGGWARHEV
jgi:hypothetical protein